VDFDAWYRNERKKHCDGVPESSPASSEETFLERISESDLSHLDSQMKLLFMRNYSKIQKQRRGGVLRTGSGILGLGARGTWVCAVACVCGAAVAFHCYLSFSHVQIAISVDSPSFRHSIHLPSAINKRLFPGKQASLQPLAIPVVASSDSASNNGLTSSDSMLKAPATAKNMPDVIAVSKPRQSIPRKTPSADTGATFQQRIQNYPLPSVSQSPKPGITGTEKAGPSQNQPQKPRQDSSRIAPRVY
jgi:hypothetical protein